MRTIGFLRSLYRPNRAGGLLVFAVALHRSLFHLNHTGVGVPPVHAVSTAGHQHAQIMLDITHGYQPCPIPNTFPPPGPLPNPALNDPVILPTAHALTPLRAPLLPSRPTGPLRQALLQQFTL